MYLGQSNEGGREGKNQAVARMENEEMEGLLRVGGERSSRRT